VIRENRRDIKFLLVDPPHRIWDILKAWVPSPGCLQLAAYLEAYVPVEFMDCTLNRRPWHDLEERLRETRPDVVGISIGCTYFTYDGYNAAALVKDVLSEAVVLVGGAHPSLNAEECLAECPDIDFICVGEGEITAREFLENVRDGNPDFSHIKGLYYRGADGGPVSTGKRPLIEDLDVLPMPAYHLVDMEHRYIGLPSEGDRAFLVNFARGCGFRCKFCSESVFWERRWRGRSPELIGEELEILKKKYNRDTFYVGDNIFNFTRERARGFIQEMKKRRLGQHFWLQSRADLVVRDEDLMRGYREAGVYQFMIGVEYTKQETLDDLNKQLSMATVEKAMQILQRNRFMIMATLMIGHWDETKEDREKLFAFCTRYVNHFGLNVVTPLPGTEFYREMKELGRIRAQDYRKFDYIQAVMPTRAIDDLEKITELHLGMIRRFYWRPAELWKMFFSRNSILRHHHRYFMKYGFEVMQHEVFGKPLWVQDTYQTFEGYLRERGRPIRGSFQGYEPDETVEL
jgi:anaerobic magnesium-protoporphyrin IX monomethyl ester cyclase